MTKIKLKLMIVAAAIGISATAIAATHDMSDGSPSVNIPVTQLKYFDTGLRSSNGIGTLQAAPAHGDLQHGAHGTFIKMPAGFVSDIHIHTGEYWAVVVSGVGVNGVPGSADVPLPVGSYWSQKGGERHVTKCISSNECIFFINQSDKFDDIPDGMKK
ncbi:MAG: DUF4437 domain-containing protein [Gallionella sp.]